jgi:hypothetical protein
MPVITHAGVILAVPSLDKTRYIYGGLDKYQHRFRRWEMPMLDVPLPDWFLELAEAHAESRLDSIGDVEKVSPSAFFKAAERARVESDSADPDLAPIARWLIAPLDERSVSPFFQCDREAYLDRLLEQPFSDDVADAAFLETGKSPVRLARLGLRYCIYGHWPMGEHYVARAVAMAPNNTEVLRICRQAVDIVDPNRTRYPHFN